jgi:polyhydroxybutyrate depolymerase
VAAAAPIRPLNLKRLLAPGRRGNASRTVKAAAPMRQSIQHVLLLAAMLILVPAFSGPSLWAQGELVFDSLEHDGLTRNYIVFEPSGYDGSEALPLVLNLHGAGSTAVEQAVYSKFNLVADTAGVLVLLPDAVENFWNSGLLADPGVVLPDDVGFLDALIDTMQLRYAVDPDRIYSMGMSNGGFMSYRLACELPGRLAAIASVTGSMAPSVFAACSPGEAVPVFQIHGTADSTVPYAGAIFTEAIPDVIDFWVSNNACPEGPGAGPYTEMLPDIAADNTTTEAQRWIACQDWSEVLLYTTDKGGHTWPGSFPLPGSGNTSQDFLAHVDIWAFFRRHNRSQTFTGVEPVAAGEIALYPNPGREVLMLEAPSGRVVRIWDALGRLQHQVRIQGSPQPIATGDWPAGLYRVQVGQEPASSWIKMR